MLNYKDFKKKFKHLVEYTVHTDNGISEEQIDGADTNGWLYIGEIVYGENSWKASW